MIKSDFHVHTSFSTDSDTPAREQIEALINKGITEICITDHEDIGYTAMEEVFFFLFLVFFLISGFGLTFICRQRILFSKT